MKELSYFVCESLIMLTLSAGWVASGTPTLLKSESAHSFISDGFVRSAPGRLSDAICEFIKNDIFYFQAVYCSAIAPSNEPATCNCKPRRRSTPLTINEFETELKKLGAEDNEIDEIVQKIIDGTYVEYRNKLFVLALTAIENREKEIEKAKAIEAEKQEAEQKKKEAEEAKYRLEFTCTAAGTKTSRAYNNGIGRPIKSYTTPFRVDCTGCDQEVVRHETSLQFAAEADGAIYSGVSRHSLNCFSRSLSDRCMYTNIRCREVFR